MNNAADVTDSHVPIDPSATYIYTVFGNRLKFVVQSDCIYNANFQIYSA